MKREYCCGCWYLLNRTERCSYLRNASIDKMRSCPRNGSLIVDKRTGYVIVCTEQMSREGTFLFWKPGGAGYTEDIDKAGVWTEKPTQTRDIVIPLNILLGHFKTSKIVIGTLFELEELMKKGEEKRTRNSLWIL